MEAVSYWWLAYGAASHVTSKLLLAACCWKEGPAAEESFIPAFDLTGVRK